ncbi:hypothetical protein [Aureitalea marina]|uniref:Uncharacterized protein n=1 Tax=Aureitalea marina TaxID=930804 RepID=A0A2S7KMA3_9FLAO|nr:hypothetical protein [Aureitalea marina]PQB03732.1 hypothetical protein BST85_01550 [Aureitalea marina]
MTITSLSAQVGINTTTPADGAMLDITANDKGILIPKVALTSRAVSAPVTPEPVVGVLVFNTDTAGTAPNDVEPGFYWWDGVQWVALEALDENDLDDKWDILGNTGTDQDVNYVGTTDNTGLTMRTNDVERFRVTTQGGGQVVGMQDGAPGAPFYSFASDPSAGIWTNAVGELDFSINSFRYININGNATGSQRGETTLNPGSFDIDFIVQTQSSNSSLVVNGENDNVGLGTTSPDESSQLQMADPDKGLLINRVTLTATDNASPITSPATGLLVYNLVSSGSGATAVSPGFYYWDGSAWVALDGTNGNDWSVEGNAGTTAGTNYIGTSDDEDVVIARNGTEELRILDDQVSINDNTPNAGERFTVVGDSNEFAMSTYASGSTSGVGLYALSQNLDAVVGIGARYGLYGSGTYGVRGISSSATGFGEIISNSSGAASLISGQGTTLVYWNNVGTTSNGTSGLAGGAQGATGTGIIGVGNGGNTSVTNVNGSGVAGSGSVLGVFGYVGDGTVANANRGNAGGRFTLDSDNDATTTNSRATSILAGFNRLDPGPGGNQDSYYGGYFSGGAEDSGTPSYAYVGLRHNTSSDGTSGTDYKIVGSGSNSTIVKDAQGTSRIMFSPEAPEIVFQDFGVGKLVNGEARIELDPILSDVIYVDESHPLKVYVTLEGECNGVYVSKKSIKGFTVKELANGNSNASFSWQIVANRADTRSSGGRVQSKHVGLRFPEAPGPMDMNDAKLRAQGDVAKKANTSFTNSNPRYSLQGASSSKQN